MWWNKQTIPGWFLFVWAGSWQRPEYAVAPVGNPTLCLVAQPSNRYGMEIRESFSPRLTWPRCASKKKYRRCFNGWYTRVLESWTLNCKFRRQAGIFSRCWLSVLILITALLASDFLRGAAVFVRMETIDYFWWAEMGGCLMIMMIGGWLMIMGMILSLPWRLLRSICLEISKHFPPSDYFKGLYFTTGWLSMFITDFFSDLRKQTNLCLGCETQLVSQKAIKAGTLNINTAYNSMPSGIRKRAITVCLYYCCTCAIAVLSHQLLGTQEKVWEQLAPWHFNPAFAQSGGSGSSLCMPQVIGRWDELKLLTSLTSFLWAAEWGACMFLILSWDPILHLVTYYNSCAVCNAIITLVFVFVFVFILLISHGCPRMIAARKY